MKLICADFTAKMKNFYYLLVSRRKYDEFIL